MRALEGVAMHVRLCLTGRMIIGIMIERRVACTKRVAPKGKMAWRKKDRPGYHAAASFVRAVKRQS